MVWVFKTNISESHSTDALGSLLSKHITDGGRWSVDRNDCDKVLRIEALHLDIASMQEDL